MTLRAITTSLSFLLLAILVCPSQVEQAKSWSPIVNRNFTDRECTMCRFSVGLVNYALSTRKGADQVQRVANSFCALAHIESPLVCSNVTKLFNHEIIKVLSNGFITSNQVCGLLSNNTCGHFHDPLADWQVNLNASYALSKDELAMVQQTKVKTRDNVRPYRVIQMSDTHIDLDYQEGSLVNCGEPLCCRASSTPITDRINNGTNNTRAGYWGSLASCDVPLRTFESMLKSINKTMGENSDIDYIIWTGDIQPHDVWIQTKKSALSTYNQVFSTIFKYLPNARIFPTFGNHEMVPVDSFSPSNLLEIAREDSPEWLYRKFNAYWSRWLPEETVKTVSKDGFYSVSLEGGLKIISLNTNFCHSNNFWLYINSTDPGNQLQWLIHELQISELENETVHIIGHIPPGASDCLKVWSRNFNQIVRRFSKTIGGQFYGHTHNSEFQIFYNQDSSNIKTESRSRAMISKRQLKDAWTPISIGFIGSSLTTFVGLNPSYRIYNIDPERNFMPVDFETFFMNLTEANLAGPNKEPLWSSLGLFTEMFSTNSTSPSALHQLMIEIVEELYDEEEELYSEAEALLSKIYRFNTEEFKRRSINRDGRLYKLYRLFNSYSENFGDAGYAILDKRKFLCRFFTAQSHNNNVCQKFIQGTLPIMDVNTISF